MKDIQYITSQHPQFIESLYKDFVKDPDSVDPELKKFFEGFDFAISNAAINGNGKIVSSEPATKAVSDKPASADIDWMREIRAYRMILGYRNKGHLLAKTNPIRKRKDRGANIELQFYGFTEADLDSAFHAGNLIGLGKTTRNAIRDLKALKGKEMGEKFPEVAAMIDKLAKRNVIHKNKAANLKSKLARKANAAK